jgi:hypothetical protein
LHGLSFNQLLSNNGFDLVETNLIRHRPTEKKLQKLFPWLVSERPELFDLYQSTQSPTREASILRRRYLASFVGLDDGKTVFIGFYKRQEYRLKSRREFQTDSRWADLKSFGCSSFPEEKRIQFKFDEVEVFQKFKGRILIDWGPGKRSIIQLATSREFEIEAIGEINLLVNAIPNAEIIDITWQELQSLPISWQAAMTQWRGIYLITNMLDGKHYVGAAYGVDNILQRWREYSKTGDGGNTGLASINPAHFRFSVLELTKPNESSEKVLQLEMHWKQKLRTREFGLNKN